MHRVLLLVSALFCLPAQGFELQPFSASYTADFKQVPVSGSAERSLVQQQDNTWKLRFKASMLVASLTEDSTFRVTNNSLQPLTYQYRRSGLGKSKEIEHDFDWSSRQVLGSERGKPLRVPLNRGLLDKSTYQIALQYDVADGKTSMSYQVLDGDDVETYDFRVLGEEAVRTRAGVVDALKVERVRDPTKSRRKTTMWFAKDWNYLLVRLHQVETDGKEYQIMLKSGEVNGRTVKGR
ncbi:DUF3108 domain-containing protein [Serpens gallinarum]|uniref:DUF3108 domain-containing protein n=1 Tax=Serpens gallinarum TaxID=2763075 RepID=A0ABR8TRP3_9PSED|nr:DUF3108 domain-containing protein [Serpens gallinarum]MBD7978438.1 DUF3108 domain-containing protein [Serpens gallinarum]